MMIDNNFAQVTAINTLLLKPFSNRNFRIRSSSKEKFRENVETARNHRNIPNTIFFSSDKYSGCHTSCKKSIKNRSVKTKKSQQNCSSQQEFQLEIQSRINVQHLKTANKNMEQTISREQDEHSKKLQNIAQLFDPKTIMKMGKKHRGDKSNQTSSSKTKGKRGIKRSIRVKQHEEEKQKLNNRNTRMGNREENEEFWRRVNESLILSPKENCEEISKDLLQIYETFVTE